VLISDSKVIGNKLFAFRKKMGFTQVEVAEAANISERTYADIERGSVGMRVNTLVAICTVLQITPDEILTEDSPISLMKQEELMNKLNSCSQKNRETALTLLTIYLDSLS